jgi:N-acetylmuramoyl-L-alanine amidase
MIRSYRSLLRYLAPAFGVALWCVPMPTGAAGTDSGQVPSTTGSIAAAASPPSPAATAIRLAGDSSNTRVIIDLSRKIELRAFTLADPDRVILDVPQLEFRIPAAGGRGLVKAYRFGQVMQGGSRIVMDLTGPAHIDNAYVLDAANGQPPRLVMELSATDRATFMQASTADGPQPTAAAPSLPTASGMNANAEAAVDETDTRPVVVIDPGHGGIDNGTQATTGEMEKSIVLDFALALRDRLEQTGRYRVRMTRSDDTFISLPDRVKFARNEKAALFISIHADALPRHEGDTRGATIYTLSNTASDAEAARLAESENKADAIAGVNLTEEPSEVADILIDLAQRETKTFSSRFARLLVSEMKGVAELHKQPLKSAGFRVLKAPDVPSVLVELGYVSNKTDLQLLVSEKWRSQTVGTVATAVDAFFGKQMVSSRRKN